MLCCLSTEDTGQKFLKPEHHIIESVKKLTFSLVFSWIFRSCLLPKSICHVKNISVCAVGELQVFGVGKRGSTNMQSEHCGYVAGSR